MRTTERAIVCELRRWKKIPTQSGWLRRTVLRELIGFPERDFAPALARLLVEGSVEKREEIDHYTGEVHHELRATEEKR